MPRDTHPKRDSGQHDPHVLAGPPFKWIGDGGKGKAEGRKQHLKLAWTVVTKH